MNQNGVSKFSRELLELCNAFPVTSLSRSTVIITSEFIWSLFALNFDLFIFTFESPLSLFRDKTKRLRKLIAIILKSPKESQIRLRG